MEHRRRTFSNFLDEENEQQLSTLNNASIDDHTEYIYNGTFSTCNSIIYGFIKLICPCCF